MPEDDAARREPTTREAVDPDGSRPLEAPGGTGSGSPHATEAAATTQRIAWVCVVSTLVAAGALCVAWTAGYAATLGVTLALALALAWGWPALTGSRTPIATSGVLAVSAVPIVLSTLRQDLLWVPAAVAFGIVLSFFAQLVRRAGREGLVLTLLSSFGGLVVMASGATAVVAADGGHARAVGLVAMAAVAAAVVADLLVTLQALARLLMPVALVVSLVAALVVASRTGQVGSLEALGVGAVAGTGSWAFRRVLSLEPAMVTARGQLAAAAGSVLAVGAVVRLFTFVS